MNLNDLVALVSKRTGYPKHDVQVICQELLGVLVSQLSAGHKVKLHDFGVFYWSVLRTRKITHPRTGEVMEAKPRAKLRFRPSIALRKGLEVNTNDTAT